MEGLFNVRELGGYPVTDRNGQKKQIHWGLLYRAGDLRAMTQRDKKTLEGRNIKTIVDFRAREEREAAPDGRIDTVRLVEQLPIDAGNLMNMAYTESGAAGEMERLYAALPEEAAPRYQRLFELLAGPARKAAAGPAHAPLLFHCSAGKDRTGLAAALILYALGADMETILADYLESTVHLRERFAPMLESQPYMVPYMTVRESYLKTALEVIDRNYGGMDSYLTRRLDVDIEHLRILYTG